MRIEAETIQDRIIRMHEDLATSYRQLADEACLNHDPFQVYFYTQASMTAETEARRIKQYMGV